MTAAIIATYGYLMVTPCQVTALRESIGDAGLTFAVFAASAIAFNAYRQIVYNIFIRMGFDTLRSCGCISALIGIGPRNFLRKQLKVKAGTQWIRANEVWAFCSVKWIQGDSEKAMRVWGAGVHGFYFLMTASFVFASVAPADSQLHQHCGYAVLVGFIALVLGVVADTFHEQAETLLAADLWNNSDYRKIIEAVWKLKTESNPAAPEF